MGKSRDRWDLYKKSANKKVEWNEVDKLPVGTLLYGFKVSVTTITRCSVVGKDILEMTILQRNHGRNSAYRTKKDGTAFKKPCDTYNYCMYLSKSEAEQAQKNLALDLQTQIKEEIELLSVLQKKVSEILT